MARRDGDKSFREVEVAKRFNPRPTHLDMTELLQHILKEIHRMSIDVSGLKASAEHTALTVGKLVELVEKALASSSDAEDKAVQEQLDAIKAGLDNVNAAGDAEVAKATPAPAPEPAPEPVVEPAPAPAEAPAQ